MLAQLDGAQQHAIGTTFAVDVVEEDSIFLAASGALWLVQDSSGLASTSLLAGRQKSPDSQIACSVHNARVGFVAFDGSSGCTLLSLSWCVHCM